MAKKTKKKSVKKSSRRRTGSRGRTVVRKKTAARKKVGGKAVKKTVRRKSTVVRSKGKTARRSGGQRSTAAGGKAGTRSRRKVGSSSRAAARVGGESDFGIPPREARKRAMQGEDLLHREGGGPRHARGEISGDRESGAGAPDSGPGSASGGDIDVDIVGVGSGSGLAQSGPDELRDIGLAETDGSSDEFASGPPARGENQDAKPNRVKGTTINPDETY